MVNSIFPDDNACDQEEALVTSTILKRKRPLDRSFHAAGVSLQIICMINSNDKKKTPTAVQSFVGVFDVQTTSHFSLLLVYLS